MSSEQASIVAAGVKSSSELASLRTRIFFVETGRAALRCLRAHPDVDAVISSWDLPDMSDGWLPMLIRSAWPSRPVIVLVPGDDLDKEVAARLIGPVGVLHEPCNPELLAQYVSQVLGVRRDVTPVNEFVAAAG